MSFFIIFILAKIKQKNIPNKINNKSFIDIFFILIFSSIIGGRLGHILLYEWSYYKNNLLEIFFIWEGGMSFFSSILFSSIALFAYAKKSNQSFFVLSDFALSFVPIGLFLGRIANFINNEIWGRDTYNLLPTIPILENGKIIHKLPIQLYEAFFEGLVILVILQYLSYKNAKIGVITIVFLFLYSIFRFILEFFKHPYWGEYILDYFTLSQVLALIMFVVAITIYRQRTIQ